MKFLVYKVCGILGVFRLFSFLNRKRPLVLAFHGVTADESASVFNYQGKHLHVSVFRRLMDFLANRGQPVSLESVVDWLEGKAPIPDRALVVTFDDGYRNNATQAAPILAQRNIPATFFIATDFVTAGEMLWADALVSALFTTRETTLRFEWRGVAYSYDLTNDMQKRRADEALRALCKTHDDDDRDALVACVLAALGVDRDALWLAWSDHEAMRDADLKALRTAGFEVGSHTCRHSIVARLDDASMQEQLERSRDTVAGLTGGPCTAFSYPNGGPGDFNDLTRKRVQDTGYRCAVTTIKRRVRRRDDPFAVPRCIVTHNDITMDEFAAEVSGFAGFLRGLRGRR